jgi:hypothetical protein
LPPNSFSTAASSTRTEARQMSGPVPSPSMKGMMGRSGTVSAPLDDTVMDSPPAGMTGFADAMPLNYHGRGR